MARTKEQQREYQRKWRAANPDCRAKEYQRNKERDHEGLKAKGRIHGAAYRARNLEKIRAIQKKHKRKKYLAIKADPIAYAALLAERSANRFLRLEKLAGRPRAEHCELCGETADGAGCNPKSGIVFDHCHETGKFRGWLCDRCNKVLGLVKDSVVLLGKMTEYLEKSHGKITPLRTIRRSEQELPNWQ